MGAMRVFLVSSSSGEDLSAMVENAFDENSRKKISSQVWLVAQGHGTLLDAYNKLYTAAEGQTPDDPVTGTIIVPVTNYYGFGNAGIWAWIKAKQVDS